MFDNQTLYLGIGETVKRWPKDYQTTTLWPSPGVRWGLTFFASLHPTRYSGPYPEAYPYRFVGFDQGGNFTKTSIGGNAF